MSDLPNVDYGRYHNKIINIIKLRSPIARDFDIYINDATLPIKERFLNQLCLIID